MFCETVLYLQQADSKLGPYAYLMFSNLLTAKICFQREIKVRYNDYRAGGPSFYYMPILQSSILITPLLKWFSSACVGFKHAALVLVPLCYLDYAVFFG